jgi:type I restriction enzyme R subunit
MQSEVNPEQTEFHSSGIQRPDFVPFGPDRALRIYRRYLPHWRQDGATYFLTFRLSDSIPAPVIRQWDYEKRQWLSARGVRCGEGDDWKAQLDKLSVHDQTLFQKHFARLLHVELNKSHGECFLKHAVCIAEIRSQLIALDGSRCHVGDFVIMPNHVHLLLTPAPGETPELLLKSLKGASARRCNRALGRSGPFWQADSYDHIVRDLEELLRYREYIRDNPRKAGIHLMPGAMYRANWLPGGG